MDINKLLDKYLDKEIKIDESSGAGSGLAIADTFWNRKANLIYVRNEEVLFSSTADVPQRQSARCTTSAANGSAT